MRNIASLNSPEQNAILAQPIDWPFPCRALLSWSHSFPNYTDRKAGIESGTRYWYRMLGQLNKART